MQPINEPVIPTSPVPPPAPPAGTYHPVMPPKPRFASDRRDMVLAIVLLVFSVLSINISLYGGFHVGFPLSFAALLLCGGIYLRGKTTPTAYTLFCTAVALAGTGVFIWHNDGVIKFFTLMGMLVLSMLALAHSTGHARRDKGAATSLLDAWDMLVVRPFSQLGAALPAIFRVKQEDRIEKRRSGGVFLGLLCALPALLVVVPLLVSADAAFEGLLRHTLLDNFGELFGSLALGLGLFCLLFSRWFSLRYDLVSAKPLQQKERRGLDPLAVNAFLATIGSVYILYLVSQLAYFFSAFSGILPAEYTVAQYARRGFFEMCVLCTINLGFVAGSLALSRQRDGKTPLSTRLLSLFILVFSLGLVAVSISKMVLYIDSFGMTRLRLFTSAFMVMLGLVLVFVIIRLFATRFSYMQAIVATVAILGLTVAYVDVDTVVAKYNVTAYQSGQLETIDVYTLGQLSDGAIPYLVDLLDAEDPNVSQAAAYQLYNQMERFGTVANGVYTPDTATDWRQYTVDTTCVKTLINTHASKILYLSDIYYY